MKRIFYLLLAVCLLMSGCSWTRSSYVSVTPHQEQRAHTQTAMISARDSLQLLEALKDMIAEGIESAAINVSEYTSDRVEVGMDSAVKYAMELDPIGTYAVEDIQYEQGTSGGQPALAVKIIYRHSRMDIQRIHRLKSMEEAQPLIAEALEECAAEVVMLVESYEERDFSEMVSEYAQDYPQLVMEVPLVSTETYGIGSSRVVEVKLTYQTPRDTLRKMQTQVKPVFDAARLYVSGDSSSRQKYSQLYAFLMARFDYRVETSVTPAYSLLRNGMGDDEAFASVYAAMCHAAGLECLVVHGSLNGEPRAWNMVLDDLNYYHVDLLQCRELGKYTQRSDGYMTGYSWDRELYPSCSGAVAEATAETTAVPEEAEK